MNETLNTKIRYNIAEKKDPINEMKKILDEMWQKQRSELLHRVIESNQAEQKREKSITQIENRFREFSDSIKHN